MESRIYDDNFNKRRFHNLVARHFYSLLLLSAKIIGSFCCLFLFFFAMYVTCCCIDIRKINVYLFGKLSLIALQHSFIACNHYHRRRGYYCYYYHRQYRSATAINVLIDTVCNPLKLKCLVCRKFALNQSARTNCVQNLKNETETDRRIMSINFDKRI